MVLSRSDFSVPVFNIITHEQDYNLIEYEGDVIGKDDISVHNKNLRSRASSSPLQLVEYGRIGVEQLVPSDTLSRNQSYS